MKKFTAVVTALSTALIWSSPLCAQKVQWDFVDITAQASSIDGVNGYNPVGFGINGTYLLGTNIFMNTRFSRVSDDVGAGSLDYDQVSLGLGYRYAVLENTDVFATFSYERFGARGTVSGFGMRSTTSVMFDSVAVALGVRSMVLPQLELAGYIKRFDFIDNELGYGVSANYYLNDGLAVNAGYEVMDDFSTLLLGVRFTF